MTSAEVIHNATPFSELLAYLASVFFSHRSVHLKILALEHQLVVYKRSVRRPRQGGSGIPPVRGSRPPLCPHPARSGIGIRPSAGSGCPGSRLRPGRPSPWPGSAGACAGSCRAFSSQRLPVPRRCWAARTTKAPRRGPPRPQARPPVARVRLLHQPHRSSFVRPTIDSRGFWASTSPE